MVLIFPQYTLLLKRFQILPLLLFVYTVVIVNFIKIHHNCDNYIPIIILCEVNIEALSTATREEIKPSTGERSNVLL